MKSKASHKFQEKAELTYEQYFRNVISSRVELVRAFEHVLGRKKTFEIIKKLAEKVAVERARQKPIKNFEDFKILTKEEDESPFWTHVLTWTYTEETPKKLSCRITECLWAKTYKEINATDIGFILVCHPDFAKARAYHPKIGLKRTKTLMQGDSYCNHTYYWKE